VVDVEPAEAPAVLMSALYFFFTLASYFVLRPIRDELGVAAGVRGLPWLFAGTLAAMLVAQPLYASLVVRYPVRRFIGITYQFFVVNLLLFYAAARLGADEKLTGRIFWVWTSVMSLFVVSVFWSVMVDIFRSAQAKRLFGFIAVGGTLGSLAGSATTALLVKTIGTVNLLLVSAVLLEIAAVMVTTLAGRFSRGAPNADGALPSDEDSEQVDLRRLPIGGSLWSGFTHVARSRYLSAVALFLALFTFGSTVLYFTQTEVIGTYFTDREARTAILARMEFATQALTALTQAFFTGRIIRTFGLPVALALMPALSMIGFAMLGLSMWGVTPLLATFVVFQVLRRAMNFSITNPSMEILFTVVSREDKYKAKNFIETFVYRAGDQLAAWGYAGLALVGLGLAAISWISVPIAGLFLAIGLWLGREQQRRAREVGAPAKVGSSASS
jgi:AAA family ATP:ADP antiporter